MSVPPGHHVPSEEVLTVSRAGTLSGLGVGRLEVELASGVEGRSQLVVHHLDRNDDGLADGGHQYEMIADVVVLGQQVEDLLDLLADVALGEHVRRQDDRLGLAGRLGGVRRCLFQLLVDGLAQLRDRRRDVELAGALDESAADLLDQEAQTRPGLVFEFDQSRLLGRRDSRGGRCGGLCRCLDRQRLLLLQGRGGLAQLVDVGVGDDAQGTKPGYLFVVREGTVLADVLDLLAQVAGQMGELLLEVGLEVGELLLVVLLGAPVEVVGKRVRGGGSGHDFCFLCDVRGEKSTLPERRSVNGQNYSIILGTHVTGGREGNIPHDTSTVRELMCRAGSSHY